LFAPDHKIVTDPDNTVTITEDLNVPELAQAIWQAEWPEVGARAHDDRRGAGAGR
jgi:hypothetical protein